jgi:hypothetical protein
MLTELIMDRCGWDAVWFLGGNGLVPGWRFWQRRHCYVGTWTGPAGDLLCVRRCETADEAEHWLSPAGRTMLDAALRSWWVLWTRR